jgi:2Fe-2S ferredoxin
MPKITFLPHEELCPKGIEIEAVSGSSILEVALNNGIALEHACGEKAACTTCHVIIRKGFGSLVEASEKEEDMLDRAWGLEMTSRLSCQTKVGQEDLTIQIPKYTLNLAKEHH